jgi:hypothetical protein
MKKRAHYVVCVKNAGYEVSLEQRKIYRIVEDETASAQNLLRVVDESGEDYLYPASFFVPIRLPNAVREEFKLAA